MQGFGRKPQKHSLHSKTDRKEINARLNTKISPHSSGVTGAHNLRLALVDL